MLQVLCGSLLYNLCSLKIEKMKIDEEKENRLKRVRYVWIRVRKIFILNVTLHLPVSPSTNNALIRCIIVLQTVFWMGIVFVNFPNIYWYTIGFYFDKHFEIYLELVQARGGQVGFDPVGKQSDLARSSKLQNVLLQLHHTFLSRMCIIEGTNVMHTL